MSGGMSASRRDFLKTAAVGAGTAPSAQAQDGKRPNVLFVFSDQQHAGTVSAYPGPALPTPVRTPAIDRLAAQGCRFDNAVSLYPVCSPYRGMLMSGLYPLRNGVVGNDTPLSNDLPTFGRLFRDAGYRTGYIGKWHLESTRAGFVPPERRQGFDHFWAVHSCNHDHFDSPYYRDDPAKELTHAGYEPDSQVGLAMDFIRDSARSESPFCLAISFGPPHNPYKAPQRYESRFQPEADISLSPNVQEHGLVDEMLQTDTRPMSERQRRSRARKREQIEDDGRLRAEILRGYYGACEALDAGMGRLLDLLDELEIADDTIVVYTSDHGDMQGAHGLSFKGPFMYEELLNIPMTIAWPRGFEGGRKTDVLASQVDVLPTLLDLAGIAAPDGMDGVSLREELAGGTIEREEMFAEYHSKQQWANPIRSVRTEQWKLNQYLDGGRELYDLANDPGEKVNLAGSPDHAEIESEMYARLDRWAQATDDRLWAETRELHGAEEASV